LLLPRLYAAALALPQVEPDTADQAGRQVTHDDWRALYTDLAERLGHWDSYIDVGDPYDEANREPMRMSLADDLADIYQDVKNGLMTEKSLSAVRPNDVLWTWRFEFGSHWAEHAARALRALQAALLVHYAEHQPETFRARRTGGESNAV
jgi:hypothetical protein